MVTGTVVDASDAPLGGARVWFTGHRTGAAVAGPPFFSNVVTTEPDGAFLSPAASLSGSGELDVHASVVPDGSSDTLRLVVGRVRFKLEDPPDTLTVTIRLP